MEYLTFNIYAVDPKDNNTKSLIGKCFNLGLAKAWVEATITIDDFEIENNTTKKKYYYNHKIRKWE